VFGGGLVWVENFVIVLVLLEVEFVEVDWSVVVGVVISRLSYWVLVVLFMLLEVAVVEEGLLPVLGQFICCY